MLIMSNLGTYELLTSAAKKVGGPLMLVGLLVSIGGMIGYAFGYKDCSKKYVIEYKEQEDHE